MDFRLSACSIPEQAYLSCNPFPEDNKIFMLFQLTSDQKKQSLINFCCLCFHILSNVCSKYLMTGLELLQKKIHTRTTDFFLSHYRPFKQDFDMKDLSQIAEVDLQCLGYGVFEPKLMLDRFGQYFSDMVKAMRGGKSCIRTLRLKIYGLAIDPADSLLLRMAKQIPSIRSNLAHLSIRTSNLSGVTLQDFTELLRLLFILSDLTFESFILQCANWRFEPMQPRQSELRKVLEALLFDSSQPSSLKNKAFRLEMSGWYRRAADAKYFLGVAPSPEDLKPIPKQKHPLYLGCKSGSEQTLREQSYKYRQDMAHKVQTLLSVMQNVEQLEIDLRNTHELLEMGELKGKIDNLYVEDRVQRSIGTTSGLGRWSGLGKSARELKIVCIV